LGSGIWFEGRGLRKRKVRLIVISKNSPFPRRPY
jgi:hypothetical protein